MTRKGNCGSSFEAFEYYKFWFSANRKVELHNAFFKCNEFCINSQQIRSWKSTYRTNSIVERNLSTYFPITFSMGDIYRKRFYTVPRLDSLCNIPGKEPAGCGQYRRHMVPGTRRAYMPLQRPAFDSTSEMSHMSLPLPLCAIWNVDSWTKT